MASAVASPGRHNFANKKSITPDLILEVPGLKEALTPAEVRGGIEVFGCTSGCGYNELTTKPFWVDFARKTIQHDTRNTTCTAPGQQTTASSGSSSTKAMVAHTRVNTSQVVAHLGAGLVVPRTTFVKDERLNRYLSESKRSALLDSHETPPGSLVAHAARIHVMIAETQAAISLGKAAAVRAYDTPADTSSSSGSTSVRGGGDTTPAGSASLSRTGRHAKPLMDTSIPVKIMVSSSAPSDKIALLKDKTTTFGNLTRNENALAIMARGLLEFTSWAQYVAWSGTYAKVRGAILLREVHDSLLFDLATVTDALLNGTAISDRLESVWDSNVFYVLGTLLFRKDDSGISAFYRMERAQRFDQLASKKLGWKPAATAAAAGAGAAAITAAAEDGGGDDAPPSTDAPSNGNPRKRARGDNPSPANPKGDGNPKDAKRRNAQNSKAAKRIQQLQQQLRDARAGGKKDKGGDDG